MKKSAYLLLFLFICTCASAQSLNGIYSVGAGGNFTTITAALNNALLNGLSGNVVLEISSGYNSSLETFPLVVKDFPGLSSANTLTIRPSASAGPVNIISSGSTVFLFDRCSHVTIDGRPGGTGDQISMFIKATNTNTIVNYTDDASLNTIQYVCVAGDNTIGNLVQFSSGTFTGSNYNKIKSCLFTNISGSSFPSTAVSLSGGYIVKNKGNIIENCEIVNFNSSGIYISGLSDSTTVKNCYFHQTEPANAISLSAIKADNATNTLISGNKITGFASTSQGFSELNGIHIESLYDFNEISVTILNNFISLSPLNEASSATISGIKYSGKRGCSFAAFNNTILISGTDDYGRFSYCINKTDSASIFSVRNNILINQRITLSCPGKQYCLSVPVILGFDSDFNTFHNGSAPATVGNWAGVDLYTFEDWQNITKADTNSNFMAVDFSSSFDLHLTGSSLGNPGLIAEVIPSLIFDIDGELRNPLFPYKGADENLDHPLPVELISFTGKSVNNQVFLSWETASELNNYGFEVERETADGWFAIAFVPGKINSSVRNTYSFTDKPGDGIFSYRLKQLDLDGSFTYSNVLTLEVTNNLNFTLSQNYPNPFNPATIIEFTLSEKNHTTLKIYDISGQLVETTINKVLDSGNYAINFNSNRLSGGIYFYELISGDRRVTKKMCLIK